MDKALTVGSLFAGIGGFDLGFERAGFEVNWCVEIDPFCRKVLAKHFPNAKRYEDVREVGKHNLEPVDVICAGFPCFPSGSLVLSSKGYQPIENIRVGDLVLTHKGRWRKVTGTGGRNNAPLVTLKGQGHCGLEATPDHPFWSRKTKGYYPSVNGKRKNLRVFDGEASWTDAKDMSGLRWACPTSVEPLPVPVIEPLNNRCKTPPVQDEKFWWIVGRWLGDGWCQQTQRPDRPEGELWGKFVICCDHVEADELELKISEVFGISPRKEVCRTATKFYIGDKSTCTWFESNFGKGASEKTLPAWVYGMPERFRTALLEGYKSADGSTNKPGNHRFTTVSKSLATSIRLLSETLGFSSSLHHYEIPPTTVIEGRVVNQKPQYQVVMNQNPRSNGMRDEKHNWYKVRSSKSCGKFTDVFNIEVEEDNTYVVENIVVHNCQDISVAGKGVGISGERSGLFFEAARIISEIRPRYAVLENVHALLVRGMDRVLGTLSEIGYDAEWHTIRASEFGLPQERERIWIVAYPSEERNERFFESLYSSEVGQRWSGGETDLQSIIDLALVGSNSFPKPLLCGVDDRPTGWVDRVGSCGNAVVPQIPEWIAKRILEVEGVQKMDRS